MIKTKLEDLSDNFNLKSKFSVEVAKLEMEKLKKSYVKKINAAYTFIHDKVFQIFVHFCGKHVYDFMLEVAHPCVIRDRFVFKNLLEETIKHANVVEISPEKENKYFERLKKDAEQGLFQTVFFSNPNLNDIAFRSNFINRIAKIVVISLPAKMVFSLLMSMIEFGFCDIVSILLTKDVDLNQIHWDGETALFKASCKGCTSIVELLLQKYADPNVHACFNFLNHIEKNYPGITVNGIYDNCPYFNSDSCPPIRYDVCINECETTYSVPIASTIPCTIDPLTVETYMQNLDSRKMSRFEWYKTYKVSPLHVAASKGYTEIVKLLLGQNVQPVFSTDCYLIASPLLIA